MNHIAQANRGLLRRAPMSLILGTVLLAVASCAIAQDRAEQLSRHRAAAATTLRMEIAEAEALSKRLRAGADAVDNYIHIGTLYNEVGIKEHTCYSLGVMLEQEPAVRHLRFTRFPSLRASDSDEAHAQRVNAQSLENFVFVANRVLNLSDAERGIEWNLDCIDQLRIAGRPVLTPGANTFYRVLDQGETLQILGAIESGFSQQLSRSLAENPRVRNVSLGSGGGSVYEAIAAGRLIRQRGINTTIWNNCYSACPLVFAGGKDRRVWSPYPTFGFHKVSANGTAVPISSTVYRDIYVYLSEMGIDPVYFIHNMWRAEPNNMLEVPGSSDHLCDSRLATWVQRGCDADLRR